MDYDLKFLADVQMKVDNIREHVLDNIEFNLRCGRKESDLSSKIVLMDTIDNELTYKIADEIDTLIQQHPLWKEWGSAFEGVNPVLFGRVVGMIRFAPPKKNVTSNDTGRERWAYSADSLVNYCGFGNGRNYNNTMFNCMSDLINNLLEHKNSYSNYFGLLLDTKEGNMLANLQTNVDASVTELNDVQFERVHRDVFRAVSVQFIKDMYDVAQRLYGNKD